MTATPETLAAALALAERIAGMHSPFIDPQDSVETLADLIDAARALTGTHSGIPSTAIRCFGCCGLFEAPDVDPQDTPDECPACVEASR